jgi:hypothetical protein
MSGAMRARLAWGATAAIAALALLAGPAQGALFLTFEPASGPPGMIVKARTGGVGALAGVSLARMPLYFVGSSVAADVPRSVASADVLSGDDRLVAVGEVVSDAQGDGALDFPVPDLPPGHYEVRAYCPPCARYSLGDNLLPVGEFQITDPNHRYRVSVDLVSLIAGLVLLVVIVLAAFVGRHRAAAPST